MDKNEDPTKELKAKNLMISPKPNLLEKLKESEVNSRKSPLLSAFDKITTKNNTVNS